MERNETPFILRGLATFSRYQIPKIRRPPFPWIEVYAAIVTSFYVFCGGVLPFYSPIPTTVYSLNEKRRNNDTHTCPIDNHLMESGPSHAAILGVIVSAPLMDICGRQKSLTITTLPFLLGCVLIFFSKNLVMIQAGRAFADLSIGITKVVAIIYVSEISRPSCRGALSLLPGMMGSLGILLGITWAGCLPSWRKVALMVMGIFPLALSLLHESPSWLLLQNQGEKAFKSLKQLRGGQEESDKMRVEDELDDLRGSIEESNFSLRKLNWRQLIWRRENILCFSLLILQQFSGVSGVVYYLAMNWTEVGSFSKGQVSWLSIGTLHFIPLFLLSIPLIDLFGRRILLIVSALLMALSHSTFAIFLYHNNPQDGTLLTSSWLPLTALYTFIAAFSIGFGPIPLLFMTELLSLKVKSYLCSVATLVALFSAFFAFQIFPTLLHHLQPQLIFLLYAVVCLTAAIFVYKFCPETMGKSFAEISTHFPHKPGTLFEECGQDFEKLELPLVYVLRTIPLTPTTRHFKNVSSICVKSPAVL